MKNHVDFFPETPESFHLRVEETLFSLEENDMKNVNVYSRRMVAVIAAILILALAATAVAVVQGNSLRTELINAGGENLAAQVLDVHISDAQNDFSFTIDEILWEEEMLFASYTVTVPDDGNVYLFSPSGVQLNGQDIGYEGGIDAEFFTHMFALGGEYGAGTSRIMQMQVPDGMGSDVDNRFSCSCVFMQAQRPLVKLEDDAYYALFTETDAYGNENQLMKNADTLYYTDTIADADDVPVIYMHTYPEVRAVMDENSVVSAEALQQTGIARNVDVRSIDIPIQKSAEPAIRFNDAAQRVFELDGYSIEITKLEISRFNAQYEAIIRKDSGEMTEWTAEEPYGQYYALCNEDGSAFGVQEAWCIDGGYYTEMNGEDVYCIDGTSEGIYPVENLTEIYLAPSISGENGEIVGYDMTRAVRITPIYNAEPAESKPDPAENDDLSS